MPGMKWQAWSEDTFARARREGRPIYVNVAAGWCHWCHVMDERTFADRRVAALLSDRFVAIRVDADARPDLAERYADWGWPANAFLTPEALPVLEQRGFQEPEDFLATLEELAAKAGSGTLRARPDPRARAPPAGSLAAARTLVAEQLERFRDERAGGWGVPQKYPFAGPVEHSLLVDDGHAEAALAGMRQLLDPVWGGMFQYSVGGTWDAPHFEKIAAIQAGAITVFSHAWHLTGDSRHREAADLVVRYVRERLTRPDGAFATSEDADAGVPGATFYALAPAARALVPPPRRDGKAYADWNGLLIHAFVTHWAATGAADSLQRAIAASRGIMGTHAGPPFRHGEEPDGVLHLRDNAAMGRALLALHAATGEAHWLALARATADWLLRELASPAGPFWSHTPDPAAAGVFTQRRTPLEDNGVAIRFLAEIALAGTDTPERYRKAAERAALALATTENLRGEAQIVGQFLLGLDWLLDGAQVHLVGESGDLRRAAVAMLGPRAVLAAPPGEYPPTPSPAAYVCRGQACSAPVTSPADMPERAIGASA